jgi:hypothetical protein
MIAPAHLIARPNPVLLGDFSGERRKPMRPVDFRGETFDRDFDDATLFFDAFEAAPGRVVLPGPPFLNLGSALSRTQFSAGAMNCRTRLRNLDRHAQVWLDAPINVSRLQLRGPLGDFEIAVAQRATSLFEGRRVIFTLSRNNPIPWILDWVRFNRDIHGADAVLIYDNASTDYDSAALNRALSAVEGLVRSVVVEWPFKYGPQGVDARRYWDSDFCQLGAWEHARWRFLQDAASVMNSDIDEFVLPPQGTSVFQATEKSRAGFVGYFGRWIVGIVGRGPSPAEGVLPRHRDYDVVQREAMRRSKLLVSRDLNRCQPKWTLAPGRCPAWAQWKVHTIGAWWPSRFAVADFSFRHFREIGSNWKYQRTRQEAFDPARHEEDAPLRAAFARVAWDG